MNPSRAASMPTFVTLALIRHDEAAKRLRQQTNYEFAANDPLCYITEEQWLQHENAARAIVREWEPDREEERS